MNTQDELFMKRALELAKLGLGHVSPNPMVGCVIVHKDKIIGEGYHQRYGEAHAEVNAINNVKDQSLLSNSTAYVSLEPCAHYGKTPPCADLLIEKGIRKVVIATQDPFTEVDGKGIQKLDKAGIATQLEVLEKEARELNKRFFTFHEKKRPYVILKWAQTSDGFIARENFDSKWISSAYARQLVHKWRAEEDAILVGKNTAIHDNPALTVREWTGRNPIRILLDSQLEVESNCQQFDNSSKTIIFNSQKSEKNGSNYWIKTEDLLPKTLLNKLYQEKIQSVIIEGGTQVLNSFVTENCWDEARIFISKSNFEKGIPAPSIEGEIISTETIFDDQLKIIKNG